MIPENEMGVIVQFAQQASAAGFEIVSIQAAFPDAIVRRAGVDYRAEFEYNAQGFRDHRHDIRGCDLVICWVNDWAECILPVLALSEPAWEYSPLTLPSDQERETLYWKLRALHAECRIKQLGATVKAKRRPRRDLDTLADAILTANPDMGPRPLARELGVSPSTASGIIKRLGSRNGNGHGEG